MLRLFALPTAGKWGRTGMYMEIFVSFTFTFCLLIFLIFIFFLENFFFTHGIYPHPHPRPTTSTQYPRPTTFSYTHSQKSKRNVGCNRYIKIPQGSRKSEGNESQRDFIQTHTMLDTLGSAHHSVLVYPQFIMIHWRTWSVSGLVELTIIKQRQLELTGTEMRTAKQSI